MTKKKFKRNRKGFVAIPFSGTLALGTLADETVIKADLTAVFGEDLYIISVDALWALRDHTPGETPLQLGFSHGDLSTAEVLENLNAEVINPDDIIAKERARRPVRTVGHFSKGGVGEQTLNDGKLLRTKVKFMVGNGFSLSFWVCNRNGSSLTTNAIVEINGVIYGRWVR